MSKGSRDSDGHFFALFGDVRNAGFGSLVLRTKMWSSSWQIGAKIGLSVPGD